MSDLIKNQIGAVLICLGSVMIMVVQETYSHRYFMIVIFIISFFAVNFFYQERIAELENTRSREAHTLNVIGRLLVAIATAGMMIFFAMKIRDAMLAALVCQ